MAVISLPSAVPNKKQINSRLTDDLHAVIVERSRVIEETHGGYLVLIAQYWYSRGAPPISALEAAEIPDASRRLRRRSR